MVFAALAASRFPDCAALHPGYGVIATVRMRSPDAAKRNPGPTDRHPPLTCTAWNP